MLHALVLAFTLVGQPIPQKPWQMLVGETRLLVANPGIRSYSVSPAGIIDVHPGPTFEIIGKHAGHATLQLTDDTQQTIVYDVTVSP